MADSINDTSLIKDTFTFRKPVPSKLASKQWNYIFDANNNNYSNQTTFNFQDRDSLAGLGEAYLSLPGQVSGGGIAFSPTNNAIGWTCSALNLIGAQTLQSAGVTLYNDQNTHVINNLRLLIEQNIEFINTNSSLIGYAIDEWLYNANHTYIPTPPVFQSTLTQALVTTPQDYDVTVPRQPLLYPFPFNNIANDIEEFHTGAATGTTGGAQVVYGRNGNYNKGFARRVAFFFDNNFYDTGTNKWNFVAIIPICLLHDWWWQLDFLSYKQEYVWQLFLNQINGSISNTSFPPIQLSNNCNSGSAPFYPNPIINYNVQAGTQLPIGVGLGNRLYYPTYKMNDVLAKRYEGIFHSSTGIVRFVNFMSTRYITPTQGTFQATNNQITDLIDSALINPVRIWALFSQLGMQQPSQYAGATQGDSGKTGLGYPGAGIPPIFGGQIYTGSITQANVIINGRQYYNNPLVTNNDFWNVLRKQFNPSKESYLSWKKWVNHAQVYCFDVTRANEAPVAKGQAVQVSLSYTTVVQPPVTATFPGDGGASTVAATFQKVYLVELMNTAVIQIAPTTLRVLLNPGPADISMISGTALSHSQLAQSTGGL